MILIQKHLNGNFLSMLINILNLHLDKKVLKFTVVAPELGLNANDLSIELVFKKQHLYTSSSHSQGQKKVFLIIHSKFLQKSVYFSIYSPSSIFFLIARFRSWCTCRPKRSKKWSKDQVWERWYESTSIILNSTSSWSWWVGAQLILIIILCWI